MRHDQAAHWNTDRTRGGDPDDSLSCQLWRRQSVEDESLWLAAGAAGSPNNVGLQCRALNHGELGGGETGGDLDQLSRSRQWGLTADLRLALGFGVQLAWFEDLYRDLLRRVGIIVTINVVVYLGDREVAIR